MVQGMSQKFCQFQYPPTLVDTLVLASQQTLANVLPHVFRSECVLLLTSGYDSV